MNESKRIQDFKANEIFINGLVIISLTGKLDALTSDSLDKILDKCRKNISIKIIIDLSELNYISSAGLRVLITFLKDVEKNEGILILCGMNRSIKNIFDISGLSGIFKIEPTLEKAKVKILSEK